MDTPADNMNGYFDAMGLSMLQGRSWQALSATIPGYSPTKFSKFVYCGLRDVTEQQVKTVENSGVEVIWGDAKKHVDFKSELAKILERRDFSTALVHLDLDVLDKSVGKVNGFESAGGLFEDDLIECFSMVPKKATPASLTVCSFDPNLGDGDKIAKIGVSAIIASAKSLLETSVLATTQ